MGMYDCVMIPCPKCGVVEEFQSKTGEQKLNVYHLYDATKEVFNGITDDFPYQCSICGTWFEVDIENRNAVEND